MPSLLQFPTLVAQAMLKIKSLSVQQVGARYFLKIRSLFRVSQLQIPSEGDLCEESWLTAWKHLKQMGAAQI